MVDLRWPDGIVLCPRCGSNRVTWLESARQWKCYGKHDHAKFSLKTGTIFEDSPISLDKWLPVVWMVVNCRNGVSSWEIHRAFGITQKTAWFMLHRARLAMQDPNTGGKLAGEIEADETFIGGKARNMHEWKRAERITGTGGKDKTIVMGILERGKKVKTKVIDNRKRKTVHAEIRKHVEAGSSLYSDALKSYEGLAEYAHQVIDHAEKYVEGNVHTNGLENFWIAAQARPEWNLCRRRTVPPVPVSG
jgi:transposase-like protein